MTAVAFTLDGEAATLRAAPHETLADVLRLNVGCGEGVCGSCTVTVDGEAVRACLILAVQADGLDIRTVRSLPVIEGEPAGTDGLTPLQRAVREAGALQCGWCTPGLLVGTAAFLRGRLRASRDEILNHLIGHLCRCTGSAATAGTIEGVLARRLAGSAA